MLAAAVLAAAACQPSSLSVTPLSLAGAEDSGDQGLSVLETRLRSTCKLTSECLLAFGLEDDVEALAEAGIEVLRVEEDAPIEVASAAAVPRDSGKTGRPLSELESFLSRYEPSSGLKVEDLDPSPPPTPVRKTVQASLARAAGPKAISSASKGAVSAAEPAVVKKLRMGEHARYTRIVLDLDRQAHASMSVDKQARMVLVDLPDAGWGMEEKWFSDSSPLVAAWLAKPREGGGTRLVVRLREEARIVHEEFLPAGDYPWHRIIFDIQSPLVHRL